MSILNNVMAISGLQIALFVGGAIVLVVALIMRKRAQ